MFYNQIFSDFSEMPSKLRELADVIEELPEGSFIRCQPQIEHERLFEYDKDVWRIYFRWMEPPTGGHIALLP